ncbi:MAG: hypothetical protein P8177_02575 [Gemmatimonadota bacterium]
MDTRVDLSQLRHPYERPIWVAAVILNVLICVTAVAIVVRGGDLIFGLLPVLASYEGQIRAIAVAAVLAPPALVATRNRRLARVRGGSVKVSPSQFPLLDARYRAHCEKLGVDAPPTLFVSDEVIDEHARAFAAWRREYIVLATDFLERELEPLQDVWSFLLGRELGRLALGHVKWWDEVLLAYVERLPYVRRPLRHVRAFSLDNIGAFVEPEGVRALIIQAAGRRSLPATDIAEQIRYALSVSGFWVRLSSLIEEQPHLAIRLHKLYDRGLFDLDADLHRFDASTPPQDVSPTSESAVQTE